MTNKNKTTNELVSLANTAPSSQFKSIPTLTERVGLPGPNTDAGNDTSGRRSAIDSDTSRALYRLIQQRTEQVRKLQLKLEHARRRRRGLEKELEVREEITRSVSDDVRQAREQLEAAAREMESLHVRYQALHDAYAQTDVLARDLGDQVAARDSDLATSKEELVAARSELADLRAYVDGRRQEWETRDSDLDELTRTLVALKESRLSLKKTLEDREAEFDFLFEQFNDLRDQLSASILETERLGEENRALRDSLHAKSDGDLTVHHDRVAVQAGELAARAQELESFKRDNERLEDYANSLRIRLQGMTESSRKAAAVRKDLERKLDAATTTIKALTSDLERSRTESETLNQQKDALEARLEREIERLSDVRIERRDLPDSPVSGTWGKEREQLADLEKQLADARSAAANYERRLRIKDGAIADLMKKLAERSESIELSRQLESALQKIDGYRAPRERVRRKGERDYRVARMLVGEADGKELRFPLFRDRLTIGRTPHNDIQLNMRFISRRHAVIATDNDSTRIIDWGSRNGVYVNQKRVTERILKSGDVITIGMTDLRFQEKPKA